VLWVCGKIALYFSDEVGFSQQPYLPYGWQKKGATGSIFAPRRGKRLNVFGLMSLDNCLRVYPSEENLTAEFIVDSLNDFLGKAHGLPVVVVMDNGPIHHAQVVKQKISEWEEKGLFLFFLPTYSPHLNPIEILWRFIKYKWLHKKDYTSWTTLKKAILTIIKHFGSTYTIDFKKLIQNNMPFNSA
jgi:transposase